MLVDQQTTYPSPTGCTPPLSITSPPPSFPRNISNIALRIWLRETQSRTETLYLVMPGGSLYDTLYRHVYRDQLFSDPEHSLEEDPPRCLNVPHDIFYTFLDSVEHGMHTLGGVTNAIVLCNAACTVVVIGNPRVYGQMYSITSPLQAHLCLAMFYEKVVPTSLQLAVYALSSAYVRNYPARVIVATLNYSHSSHTYLAYVLYKHSTPFLSDTHDECKEPAMFVQPSLPARKLFQRQESMSSVSVC